MAVINHNMHAHMQQLNSQFSRIPVLVNSLRNVASET